MAKQASFHVVHKDGHLATFRIDAPAVSAALTRSNGVPTDAMTHRMVSALISAGVLSTEPSETGADLKFRRNEDGKWFLQVPYVTCDSCARGHECATPVKPAVADTNTVVKGHHACVRCNGSGVVPSSRDAGKCYRCKGKGYTTIIDRERNAAHSRHRKARIEAIRTAHANA